MATKTKARPNVYPAKVGAGAYVHGVNTDGSTLCGYAAGNTVGKTGQIGDVKREGKAKATPEKLTCLRCQAALLRLIES